MNKVAILLPVFNNLDFTRKCIQLLDEQALQRRFDHCSFHAVVTDDGSTDGTGEWLRENYPNVTVLTGDGSLWWSGGVNVGARYAVEEMEAQYLLLWNNDVIPAPDYFNQIDNLLETPDPESIIGSKIYYEGDQQIIWSFGGMFNARNGRKRMVGFTKKDGAAYETPREVDWLPGMGTLIPAGTIGRIGYWDAEIFPQYHGDSDFTLRAKKAGYKIVVMPGLKLWNDKSSSGLTHGNTSKGLIRTLTSIRSNDNIRKNILFYRRHAASPMAFLYLLKYYFFMVGGFFKWKLLALVDVKKKK